MINFRLCYSLYGHVTVSYVKILFQSTVVVQEKRVTKILSTVIVDGTEICMLITYQFSNISIYIDLLY